jgi:cell division protein FtsB
MVKENKTEEQESNEINEDIYKLKVRLDAIKSSNRNTLTNLRVK